VLEAHADGFGNAATAFFRVDEGQAVNKNIVLTVAGVRASVVVVATGTPQTAEEVSKAVTVLSADEIEAKRSLTLSEALRGTPGLRVQQQGSIGSLVTLRIRGQRNYDTAVLLDGLRVRDASDINGSAAPLFSDLLPSNLSNVEILRGSGSSIYGTNAIGGVIDISPRVGAGTSRFEAGFDGGNLGLFRGRIGGSGGIGDKGGYSFNVTRIDVRKGVDGNDQYGNTNASGRFQINVSSSMLLSANFLGSFANARVNDSPFALPAAFAGGGQNPSAIEGVTFHSDFNNPDEGRRTNFIVGSLKFTQRVNDVVSYSVAYQRVNSHRRNYNGPSIDPKFATLYPFGDFEFNNTNRGTTDLLDARANLQLGRSNLVTVGAEFERESLFQESLPSFSSVNDTTDRQRTYALFGQDQVSLIDGRLQGSISVRAQGFRIKAADRPGSLQAVQAENSVVGDGALSYFFRSTGTKFRGHVGNGFRAPSLFERFGEGNFSGIGFTRFGDPTIRAEQSISLDVGIDQNLLSDRIQIGATYFYTHLQRSISFTSFVVDPLGLGRLTGYENTNGGFARGIEVSADMSLWRGSNIRSSYTFTNSDRVVAHNGLQPEFVIPKNLFGLTFIQRYKAFQLSANINYTGSYIAPVFENDFPFRTAALRFDGYVKADLFGSYERALSDKVAMTLFAGADNIFNQKYFENGFRVPGVVGRGGVLFRF
jgi:iron complex outermembrane receptor protein